MSAATVKHDAKGAYLDMPCPRFGKCNPAPRVHRAAHCEDAEHGRIWQWLGTEESPTIIPSVGCDNKCGEHRVITNGEWKAQP